MKIALVSDTHFASCDTLLAGNWGAAVQWIRAASPDLVVHLGDITANGVHEAGELQHARKHFEDVGVEVRFAPGNHDIGDHAAGPGLTTDEPFDPARLDDYRRLFGPDRWSLLADGWQFIGINAPVLATGAADETAQYDWLEATLRARSDPLGVFLHKPLFRDAADEDIVHTRYVPAAARGRLLKLLATRDLRFVAAGHTHQVRQRVVDGVEHVWVPSTAFTLSDARQERIGEKLVGVMMLDIEGDHHRFTHIIPANMRPYDLMEFAHIYPALAAPPPAEQ